MSGLHMPTSAKNGGGGNAFPEKQARRHESAPSPFVIPAVYADGYEAARKVDPEMAETYIRYTTQGDPLADEAVEQLARVVEPERVHAIIAKTVDRHFDPPKDTPEALLELISSSAVVPEWFDPKIAHKASKAFLRNSDLVLGALVGGAIVEGFSTRISKSFRIRSRITVNGVRRLKQNTLHLTEQFMPGGVEPGGDAWKLSLRIRLVHAQSRKLIRESDEDEWDVATDGMPLSAAHMLLGAAAFSGRLMHHVRRLGGDFTRQEREAYVHVWRYTGLVFGIPESILFHDLASANRTFQIAAICEPPPDEDAILMANSIINSAPILLGVTEMEERRKMAEYIYQVSRGLIGDELADAFRFPKSRRIKQLPLLYIKNRAEKIALKLLPMLAKHRSMKRFDALLDAGDLGELSHSYALPTTLYEEDSRKW